MIDEAPLNCEVLLMINKDQVRLVDLYYEDENGGQIDTLRVDPKKETFDFTVLETIYLPGLISADYQGVYCVIAPNNHPRGLISEAEITGQFEKVGVGFRYQVPVERLIHSTLLRTELAIFDQPMAKANYSEVIQKGKFHDSVIPVEVI